MKGAFFDRILSLFDAREWFVVVELLNDAVRVTRCSAKFPKRQFTVVESRKASGDAQDCERALGTARQLLKRVPAHRHETLFSLDPRFATTVHATVIVVNDNYRNPVGEADLDNIISQGIWKLFDRERSRAAAKMGVGDVDVVLTDVQVEFIKLDGHKVVNPLGFSAKTVELALRQTFTSRKFIDCFRAAFPHVSLESLREAGVTHAETLLKLSSAPPFLLADVFSSETDVFAVEEQTSLRHLDHFSWGESHLIQALAGACGTDFEGGLAVWRRYLSHQLSPGLKKKFEKILSEELRLFAHGLSQYLERVPGASLYLCPFFELPEAFRKPHFLGQFSVRPKRLHFATTPMLRTHFDITVADRGADKEEFFSPLARVLGFYFSPQNDTINKIARRHARWLIAR